MMQAFRHANAYRQALRYRRRLAFRFIDSADIGFPSGAPSLRFDAVRGRCHIQVARLLQARLFI